MAGGNANAVVPQSTEEEKTESSPVATGDNANSNDEEDLNESFDETIDAFKLGYPHLNAIREVDPTNPCMLCKTPKIDEIGLGPLYSVEGSTTHYYCMVRKFNNQKGTDKQGILGFMPEDIRKEVRRASHLKCIYCNINGAAVGCCQSRCKASYHFPCGLSNKAAYQFFGNYESYCIHHSSEANTSDPPPPDHQCPVCIRRIREQNRYASGKCCLRSIYHKRCIQKVALNSGYFFKCPTCNASDTFQQNMRYQGIFVPEQDASWEQQPNAFADLQEQYSRCDAKPCLCPMGIEHGPTKGPWSLARCRICGSAGTHRKCSKLDTVDDWACELCLGVEERTKKNKKDELPQTKPNPSPPKEESETSSDEDVLPSTSAAACRSIKKETSGTTNQSSPTLDNEEIDVGKIFIMPGCMDYFPFKRATLQEFAKERDVIPDWRGADLFIPLVDIFSDTTDLLEMEERLAEREDATATAEIVSIDQTKSPEKEASVVRRKTTERRPSRKISNWQKGVVKKGKGYKKRNVEDPQLDNMKNTTPVKNTKNVNVAAEPQPSTSSQAILEGIRRSQTTLMRMATNTNGIAVATPVPNGPTSGKRPAKDELQAPNKKRKLEDRDLEKSDSPKHTDSIPNPKDCNETESNVEQNSDSSSSSSRAACKSLALS